MMLPEFTVLMFPTTLPAALRSAALTQLAMVVN
jgi:hypothetical protein